MTSLYSEWEVALGQARQVSAGIKKTELVSDNQI
jgi:hypothetical protein